MNREVVGGKEVRKSGSVHLVIGHHNTGKISGAISVGSTHLTCVFASQKWCDSKIARNLQVAVKQDRSSELQAIHGVMRDLLHLPMSVNFCDVHRIAIESLVSRQRGLADS